jgi:hypothetical protein
MLLTAMYKNAGMEANPVLLSTREHGKANNIYPLLDKFNYLVSQVKIDDKSYLTDACNTQLGFGFLDGDCYNGGARVINEAFPELINLSADSLKESKITSVFIFNDGDSLSAGFSSVLGQLESQDIREQMEKTSRDDFFKKIQKAYSFDVSLSDTSLDSLHLREEPVAIKYNMKFKWDDDVVYFTPLLAEAYKENPFKSAERFYPVEMPACFDETFILNMEVPKGYKIDELPKSARVLLNETDGMFEYLIQAAGDRIQMRCRVAIKKANFMPDDYQTLRDFFAFVVKKQAEQIVFKKNQ